MIKYDSIFFDLDGTLWDATGITAETWVEVRKNHPDLRFDPPITREDVGKHMGITNEELANVFFPQLPFETAYSLIKESCDLENRILAERGGKLFDGVEETLQELKKKGKRLFIVSNCQEGYIDTFISAHGFYSLFEDFESSGRSGRDKGDNIISLMVKHGVRNGIFVGDTRSDELGAKKAGIPFVYAKYGFGEEFGIMRARSYDLCIENISELTVLEN